MAIRTMRTGDDPLLRKRSREVEKIDERIITLLDDLADTLHASENGAAISACQVGVLKRVVVIDFGDGPLELINPMLIGASGEQVCMEGCLSFPGRFGETVRPLKVTVQALDRFGVDRLLEGEGELAKCFCHELDHLDGILFLDRLLNHSPD